MITMREKVRRIGLAAVMIVAVACGTDLSGPQSIDPGSPALARLSEAAATPLGVATATVKVLGRKTDLSSSVSATAVIDDRGGTIQIPETGFSLYVPMGALSKKTRITVTAMAGSGVAYHFEPHGLAFNVPVWFTQDTRFTQNVNGLTLQGAYFKDDKQVDNHQKSATIDEVYQVNLDPLGLILFGVHHFSGYLVSCA